MKHKVITIGCEYGAGGPEIGKRIAQALGIEFYDRDLVDKVVEQIGVDRDLVKRQMPEAMFYTALRHSMVHGMQI